MKSKFSRQNINKIAAGLLAVWMSGVVLLFCCETPQTTASEIESCPLAKISHCEKTSNRESVSQIASFQADNQKLDCCRFLPNIFDKARKVESNSLVAEAATSEKISPQRFSPLQVEFNSTKFYHPLVLNRGGTYLKNHVIRI